MTISNTDKLAHTARSQFIINPSETILVTGSNGYVGSMVVRTLLSYGFKRIRCLTRSTGKSANLEALAREFGDADLDIVKGNLLSTEDCAHAAKDISVVYHLAAGVEKSYAGCFLNSVVTTRNLLEAVIKEPTLKRFVNVSSVAVYTNNRIPRGGLLDESCEVDGRMIDRHEPYTYGKAKQDEIVLEYAEKHHLPYVIVRPSVIFGPGKRKISDRVGTSTFGVFLHLGLNNTIPLTYIDNCAEAIVLAGLKSGIDGQVFNIVDDDLPTSREFLRFYKKKVRKFVSIPVPYPIWYFFCSLWGCYSKWSEGQLPPVFNHAMCSVYWKGNKYSNQKAKQLLDWQPRVPMKESLETFFAYMKERG
ncbi:NAD(P)-dependent oxidoreductase [Methylobacter sp. Wu1]|uniref:NAD-dependent epimerase/dehydratase family protein n=1 Tax=Methylobacter sp. Wu1 TaxID=3119359 RepID=UPI002F91C611